MKLAASERFKIYPKMRHRLHRLVFASLHGVFLVHPMGIGSFVAGGKHDYRKIFSMAESYSVQVNLSHARRKAA
jgi:hypothetical protein